MRRQYLVAFVALIIGIGIAGSMVIAQEEEGQGGFFDADQQSWVPMTAEGRAQLQELQPTIDPFCLSEFMPIPSPGNPLMCISPVVRGTSNYPNAIVTCRMLGQGSNGRIATYEDLTLLYLTRADLAPSFNAGSGAVSKWLGNITADDQALCGNANILSPTSAARFNFDGNCNRARPNTHTFFCAHDPIPTFD
jgi:hypothetical protein